VRHALPTLIQWRASMARSTRPLAGPISDTRCDCDSPVVTADRTEARRTRQHRAPPATQSR
jgi:hypothetical protein